MDGASAGAAEQAAGAAEQVAGGATGPESGVAPERKPAGPPEPAAGGAALTPRGEATRRRLLEAAERVIGEKGFFKASVVDITRGAEVGHGTFYLYFDSKEAIVRELVRQLSRDLRSALREAVEGLDDRVEMERAGFRAFFRFVVRRQNLYKIVRESEFVDPAISRWYYERLAEGYVEGLERAMDAGQIRRLHPESLAACLMGIGHFLGMWWVLWEGREPPEEAVETLMALVEGGMRSAASPVPAGGAR